MLRTHTFRAGLVALMAAVLAGCGGLSDLGPNEEINAIYRLVPADLPSGENRGSVSVILNTPTMPRAFAGFDIAVSRSAGRVEFYPSVRWGDTAVHQFERFIWGALAASERFRPIDAALRAASDGPSLRISLNDFSYHPDDGDMAVVAGTVTLVSADRTQVLATTNIRATATVTNDGSDGVVAALRTASGNFAADMIAWMDDKVGVE